MDDLTATALTDLRATVQRLSDELALAREVIEASRVVQRLPPILYGMAPSISRLNSAVSAYDTYKDQTL